MSNLSRYAFLFLLLMLTSCGASRRAARTTVADGTASSYAVDYLNRYSALAVSEMKRTGIPASITLAQGMVESNYGRSTLARKGNNHFGIKCHSDWKGGKVYHDDNRRGECFRAYPSAEDSYRDHSDFLVNGSRYRDLFRLASDDYKGWAHGLKKAGYATDPKYPSKLIAKIEEYGLHRYDTGAGLTVQPTQRALPSQAGPQPAAAPVPATRPATETADNSLKTGTVTQPEAEVKPQPEAEEPIKVISLSNSRIRENNSVEYVIAEEGETFESIAEEFNLLSWEISRYNDVPAGATLKPGQMIYLQPKRNRAAGGYSVHVATAGDTMRSISQKYAVRLTALYKMNLMDEGTECAPGQKVRIR
ncbi:MAG: glucosaminidase domain-containing protein [Bacteroidales bacterium]|jgi:LysM repeat protein|nr:glucosaminidase domain-containing protein [Bacteroidales bacterium]